MSATEKAPLTSATGESPAHVVRVEARRTAAQRRRRARRRRIAAGIVLLVLAPVVYSYVTTMIQPSSLPLGIRSVEWVRTHHGAWLVNKAETHLVHVARAGQGRASAPHAADGGSRLRRACEAHARCYRPSRIAPVIRPALPGEGVWRSTGRVVAGAPPVLVTTFRTDPVYPRIVAYVAWFDHTRTQLALYPGRYEPPHASPRGPMEVPQAQRWRLLATFNSGFMNRDSHGGFFVDGHSAAALRPGQGTIVAYKDGRVDILSWHGHSVPGPKAVLARQNLPLIVDHGRPNPLLADNSLWGSTLGNAVRVWRSGAGIDRHGNIMYLAAEDQTAASLAVALMHAGAVRAVELDINAEWPSLVTYGRGGVGNATKVVPNYQQSTNRYLVPDDRDFFAIYRRTTTGALRSVPFG